MNAANSRLTTTLRLADTLLAVLIALISLSAIGGSLSELHKRKEIEAEIINAIASAERSAAERVGIAKVDASSKSFPSVDSKVNGEVVFDNDLNDEAIFPRECERISDIYENDIRKYRKAMQMILINYRLSVYSGDAETITEVVRWFRVVVSCTSPDAIKAFNVADFKEHEPVEVPAYVRAFFSQFRDMTDNFLSLFVVVGCGCLGALVAGLRRKDELSSLRDMIVGGAAGFIVYLGIKGGKYVFIASDGIELEAINHYGVAFASIIVGLNVEWAHETLSKFLDNIRNNLGNSERQQKPE